MVSTSILKQFGESKGFRTVWDFLEFFGLAVMKQFELYII